MKKTTILILSLLIMFSLISCKKNIDEELITSAIIVNEISDDESSDSQVTSEDEPEKSEVLKNNAFFDMKFMSSEKWSIMEQDEARLIYFDNQVGSVKISIDSEYSEELVSEYTQDDLKKIASEIFDSYSNESGVNVISEKKISTTDIGGQMAVALEFDINISSGDISQKGKIIFSIIKYENKIYYVDYNVPLEYADEIEPVYEQFIKDISF